MGVGCWHCSSLLHNSLIIRLLMSPSLNCYYPGAVMSELWDMLNGLDENRTSRAEKTQ